MSALRLFVLQLAEYASHILTHSFTEVCVVDAKYIDRGCLSVLMFKIKNYKKSLIYICCWECTHCVKFVTKFISCSESDL
jgi:hypothetical protein